MTRARVLLTGATGYIASHTWLALQAAGFEVVGVDNFVNSSPEVLNRLHRLSAKAPVFEQIDVLDQAALGSVFSRHDIDAVIHFAALKAVGESSAKPLDYYQNNLGALMSVVRVMGDHGVKNLVFSSSATVYGTPETLPLREPDGDALCVREALGDRDPTGDAEPLREPLELGVSVENDCRRGNLIDVANLEADNAVFNVVNDPNPVATADLGSAVEQLN
jgi:nucleoside-diphosphate-sugar epimerase